jgi:hypothetical protein
MAPARHEAGRQVRDEVQEEKVGYRKLATRRLMPRQGAVASQSGAGNPVNRLEGAPVKHTSGQLSLSRSQRVSKLSDAEA